MERRIWVIVIANLKRLAVIAVLVLCAGIPSVPAAAQSCDELARRFHSLRDDPVPPGFARHLASTTGVIFEQLDQPQSACADADVYIGYRRETYAVQRKLIFQCNWPFGTKEHPLDRSTIDKTIADEEKDFAETRKQICALAAKLLGK